ncbi:MAG: hypothetical protein AAGD96_13040, partial [Chloroflexota bacterium]
MRQEPNLRQSLTFMWHASSKIVFAILLFLQLVGCSAVITIEDNDGTVVTDPDPTNSPTTAPTAVIDLPTAESTLSPTEIPTKTPVTPAAEAMEEAQTPIANPIQLSDSITQRPRACMLTSMASSFVCITHEGQWNNYDESNLPIGYRFVDNFEFCNDGRLIIKTPDHLYIEDIGGWQQLPPWPETFVFGPESIGCTAPGDVWITHESEFIHLQGAGWAPVPVPIESTSQVRYGPLQVSPDGDIWLLEYQYVEPEFDYFTFNQNKAILHFDGIGWERFPVEDLPQSDFDIQTVIDDGPDIYQGGLTRGHFKHFYDNRLILRLDPAGNPFLIKQDQVIWLEDGEWIGQRDPDLWNMFNFIPDGKGGISGYFFPSDGINPDKSFFDDGIDSAGAGLFGINTNEMIRFTPANSGLSSGELRNITADRQGRIWMSTYYGLSIYSNSGEPFDQNRWRAYYMDNSPLAGHSIQKVLVFGDGPELPDEQSFGTGSISGTLFEGDQPLAEIEVEICSERLILDPGQRPPENCQHQRHSQVVLTDQEGRFEANNLPIGVYFIYPKIDGEWSSLPDSEWWSYAAVENVFVNANQDSNIGLHSIVPRIEYEPPDESAAAASSPIVQYDGGPRACMKLDNDNNPFTCIKSDGEWVTYTAADMPQSSWPIRFDLCEDGRIVLQNYSGLYLESGQEWLKIVTSLEASSINGLACNQTNQIWITDLSDNTWFREIPLSEAQNEADWKMFDLSEIFPLADPAIQFPFVRYRFEDDGTVWAFSSKLESLSKFDGSTWQPVSVEELPFGILELAPDVMNSPFSVSGNFVYRLVEDNWAE